MSVNFSRLGVFATPDEIAAVHAAARSPLIYRTNPEPPGPGVPHAVSMFRQPIEVAHAAALAHGLEEFDGFYGIDLESGEFLKPEQP